MDHLDISSTVGNTGAFRVEGAAKLLTCYLVHFFLIWYLKLPLRKLATKIFELYILIFGVCICVYLLSEKISTVVFYIQVKNVFYTV